MSVTMVAGLTAALNASFTAGGWRMVGVFIDEHAVFDGTNTVIHRTATLQAEHEAMGLLHVWTLEGTDAGYTAAKLTAGGGRFETTDAILIARLAAAIDPALLAMQSSLVDALEVAQ